MVGEARSMKQVGYATLWEVIRMKIKSETLKERV